MGAHQEDSAGLRRRWLVAGTSAIIVGGMALGAGPAWSCVTAMTRSDPAPRSQVGDLKANHRADHQSDHQVASGSDSAAVNWAGSIGVLSDWSRTHKLGDLSRVGGAKDRHQAGTHARPVAAHQNVASHHKVPRPTRVATRHVSSDHADVADATYVLDTRSAGTRKYLLDTRGADPQRYVLNTRGTGTRTYVLDTRGSAAPRSSSGAASTAGTTISKNVALYNALDAERRARGLPLLKRSEGLGAYAQWWSEQQAARSKIEHNPDFSYNLIPAGAKNWAEGIGAGDYGKVGNAAGARQVVKNMFNTPSHNRPLLSNDFNTIGFGWAVDSKGTSYVTFDYGVYGG